MLLATSVRFPFAGHATSTSAKREIKCALSAKPVSSVSRVLIVAYTYTKNTMLLGEFNLSFDWVRLVGGACRVCQSGRG